MSVAEAPARPSVRLFPLDIEPIQPVLARVIDRWHPLQIWLFGSREEAEQRREEAEQHRDGEKRLREEAEQEVARLRAELERLKRRVVESNQRQGERPVKQRLLRLGLHAARRCAMSST